MYRYTAEAVGVLAARAPDLATAVTAASVKAFVILDGTPLPIDRLAADRPFRSGKHKRHGTNVQVTADPHGKLLWASAALPDAVHDIRAVRTHGVVDALTEAGPACWADKGHQGAGSTVRVPFRDRWERLSTDQRAVNAAHARIRDLGSEHDLVVFGVGSGFGRGAASGRPAGPCRWEEAAAVGGSVVWTVAERMPSATWWVGVVRMSVNPAAPRPVAQLGDGGGLAATEGGGHRFGGQRVAVVGGEQPGVAARQEPALGAARVLVQELTLAVRPLLGLAPRPPVPA